MFELLFIPAIVTFAIGVAVWAWDAFRCRGKARQPAAGDTFLRSPRRGP